MKFIKKPKFLSLGQDNTRHGYRPQTDLLSCKLAEQAMVDTMLNISQQCALFVNKINCLWNRKAYPTH